MGLLEQVHDSSRFSFRRIRRNHALEHATLQVLSNKKPDLSLAGYSDSRGFWVLGSVQLEDLQQAVDEALRRLKGGETELAIHPNCGTNLVASGIMAGSIAWLGMLGTGGSTRKKLDRWPLIMALATVGLIASQPVGPVLQQRFTTATDVENMRIREIMRYQRKGVPLHRVLTES